MSYKCLLPEPAAPFGMEDVFRSGDAAQRAWVNDWRKLPHIKPELLQQFAYSQPFVDEVSARIEHALQQRVATPALAACGRLHVSSGETLQQNALASRLPPLPIRYIESSDTQLVAADKASSKDEGDLLHCRLEGEYMVSYQTPGGWVGLSKDLLTAELGAGREVQLAGLPPDAVAALTLLGPGLVPGAD